MGVSGIYDVIVVGAGPAGSTAARILVDQGFEVLIIDRKPFPRRKPCGGGLVWRVLKRLPVQVRDRCVEAEHRSAWLHFASLNKTFVVTKRFPVISTVERSRFDHAMLSEATKRGALFLGETSCEDLKIKKDTEKAGWIEVKAGGRRFIARYVIAADGAVSTVGRMIGALDGRVLVPALEGRVVRDEAPGLEKLAPVPRFDFGIVPNGYGWVFPRKETYCLGVVCYDPLHAATGSIRTLFAGYARWLGINEVSVRGLKGALIPVSPRVKESHSGGILFVGDALGWTDPIMAEGISGAVISGTEAARSIIEDDGNTAEVLKIYRQAVERKFLREYRLSSLLSHIVYRRPKLRDRCFSLYGREIADVVTDVFSGVRSYKWLLFWPINYLKAVGLFPFRYFRTIVGSVDHG